jgi:hypothetical protein
MPSSTREAKRNDANYLGSYSGAIGQAPSDAGAAEMPAGDLESARAFGERVATISARFRS